MDDISHTWDLPSAALELLKDQQLTYPYLTLWEVTAFQAKAEITPKDICLLTPPSPLTTV